MRDAILAKLTYMVGKDPGGALDHDWFMATALAVRDRIVDRWLESAHENGRNGGKHVYYFSLEFLIGRLLTDAMSNLGLMATVREALGAVGRRPRPAVQARARCGAGQWRPGPPRRVLHGKHGVAEIPAYGYGIRYDHGIFRQVVKDGWQHELPEDWLSFGNPWEFERPDVVYRVDFGGTVEEFVHRDGTPGHVWHPEESVSAVAFDTPITGWRGRRVNTLRLWSARAADPISLEDFNRGDHVGALADRVRLEAISRVLYPSDETPAGQTLRLRQEFFFASASLQDLIRRHKELHGELASLADHAAIQLNDTHPAIAVPELMRLLVDLHGVPWDVAWKITTSLFNYTNHTLLPEALETWAVPLLERMLPRHMQIIHEINARHLAARRAEGRDDSGFLNAVSLVAGDHAADGAFGLPGVAPRQRRVGAAYGAHAPHRVPRPAQYLSRPHRQQDQRHHVPALAAAGQSRLTQLIVDAIGPRVLDDADALAELAPLAQDAALRQRFAAVRRVNKVALSRLVAERLDVSLDPDALFDVHVKRIHEYKRQLLNIVETVALHEAIRADPARDWVPRVKIFAGKAAAGYHQAKLIIKLVNDVAKVINGDPAVRGLIKVIFLPNYNVSLAEAIIPAADLSQQISTAGMEASGTGNMKLALNGALTIGTLDGANIEILERVDTANFFLFGLTAAEVDVRRREGAGTAGALAASPSLSRALEAIRSGVYSPDDPNRFRDMVDGILHRDYFMVTADFDAYRSAQLRVDERWRDPEAWWSSAVLNTSRVGWFSADRAIREYADEIWNVGPGSR